ncbi:putative exported domain protein, partial [Chlamydia psittaci 84-8471/1]
VSLYRRSLFIRRVNAVVNRDV